VYTVLIVFIYRAEFCWIVFWGTADRYFRPIRLYAVLYCNISVFLQLALQTQMPTSYHLGRRYDMPPVDDSSTRGGSSSVRGQVRSPHMAKLQAASVPIAQGSCAPRAAAPWDRQTDRQRDGSRYRLMSPYGAGIITGDSTQFAATSYIEITQHTMCCVTTCCVISV